MMTTPFLVIHPNDNIATALKHLKCKESFLIGENQLLLNDDIPAKHKFCLEDIQVGQPVIMYGLIVGIVVKSIKKGELITAKNIEHDIQSYKIKEACSNWIKPDVSRYQGHTFMGYHRADGRVGTMNYWLIIPMVFCENRNVELLRELLEKSLGYANDDQTQFDIQRLIDVYQEGGEEDQILSTNIYAPKLENQRSRVFPNVDGIRFLTHQGGCGGSPSDSEALCKLLSGYIDHPNVAGATVLSLGCQHAQVFILKKYLKERNADEDKPVFYLEQQASQSERHFIEEAIKKTFLGMINANKITRQPAPLSKLKLGLECGGSDGFSGISANPALGYTSDLLVALGGTSILSEFPELNGVEQELINRCVDKDIAQKFITLMSAYSNYAASVGSSFKDNPSPGNIADGLITDAIKSAGAARKGGSSPIADVLDYGESATVAGLHLLCTPGNDVESTTGLAASGANLIVFTTGLGTPTGNPVAPTIKMSTNTALAKRMSDIIDIDAGTIITGEDTIESKGRDLLEYIIKVASGEETPHAVRLRQDDFIPWKRGVSL